MYTIKHQITETKDLTKLTLADTVKTTNRDKNLGQAVSGFC